MFYNHSLVQGKLLNRINRFVIQALVENEIVYAHCPNSGTLLTCFEKWCTVYLSKNLALKRKYIYTWELSQINDSLIFINTLKTNTLVLEALQKGVIHELTGYEMIISEPRLPDNKRLDLLLIKGDERCYVEVKNATLLKDNYVMFPDAITKRGQEHLKKLIELKKQGFRAVILFHVARTDGTVFSPASHIDSTYAKLFYKALENGVEALAYRSFISANEVRIIEKIPII